MVVIHLTKHFYSGFMKSMAVVSGDFKQSVKNYLTIHLYCSYNRCHCRAIQIELDCILRQAEVVEREEVRLGLDKGGVVLLQGLSGSGEGWAGGQEGLHCPFVGHICVPAVWECTQASSVPRNPVPRECLHPVPPRQEPCLCDGLLGLPWGGPAGPEHGMALGQAKEPGLQLEEGREGVSLGPELVQPELQDSRLSTGLDLHLGWLRGQTD